MSIFKNKEENKKESNETNSKDIIKDATELSIRLALRKKRISVIKPKEDQILDLLKDELSEGIQVVQNPKLLFYFLLKTPVFKQYIYINRFPHENLINSFSLGKYVILKKDTILFKQGDKTDKFYLVLSGCIGFILTTYEDSILKTNPYSREVNSIRVGAYFGEWGFIYRINRTVTAYAKENTLLLGFDKKTFRALYQNNIIYSENNIKKFVLKHIKAFKELNEISFNQYYREIKKIYCIQGQVIFHEGEAADSFYLVYMGSCTVKKGLTNIIIKDSGDFIGIESLFKDKYETTIYPYTEGTVLFKFLLNSISSNIISNLKKEFIDYYKTQKKIIKISTENYFKYKNKYQMNFLNLIKNMKKNKLENNKRGNNIKLDELQLNKESNVKDKVSSPCKIAKIFNLTNYNNKNMLNNNNNINNNIIESIRIEASKLRSNFNREFPIIRPLKLTNESTKKFVSFDSNNLTNSFSGKKLQRNISQNKTLNNINTYNKNIDIREKKIRSYSSLHRDTYNKFRPKTSKNKIKFFYNGNRTDNIRLLNNIKKNKNKKYIFTKNIILKENKKIFPLSSRNRLNKNNSITDVKWIFDEKKLFKYINEKNKDNSCFSQKMLKKIEVSKKNHSHSVKKIKDYKKEKHKKNYYINCNYEVPLMIIRNVSFSPRKLK